MCKYNQIYQGINLDWASERGCSGAGGRKFSFDAFKSQAFVQHELLGGEYVAHYGPDAHTPGMPAPTGIVRFTRECNAALRIMTVEEAIVFVRRPSKITPFRRDGKPNRPPTLWSLIIEAASSHPERTS